MDTFFSVKLVPNAKRKV